jgi:hypothetical protein
MAGDFVSIRPVPCDPGVVYDNIGAGEMARVGALHVLFLVEEINIEDFLALVTKAHS